ncbi:aminotransferase [Sulfobacillus thermosulfidooxidans]|uniref:aminotransferase n=1 Tax=Sulfobacillus thermosulfidooxidans TaxID=28034 RepID=UPI0006B47FAA|nr:aminotransferase [Sulfobacillus thermosulfidooxidans]
MSLRIDMQSHPTLHDLDRAHIWHPLTQHQIFTEGSTPLIIVGGHGSTVISQDGRAFLDAAAGLWCVNVGYGRQELAEAGSKQLYELAYYPLIQSHPRAIELSTRLAGYLPDTPHIYFSNSGSEANEVAFKAVRQYWKQKGKPSKIKILSRFRGYHGTTLGALAATGQPERRRDYEPLPPGFLQVSQPYCYRCPFQLSYPSCHLQCAEDFARRIEIEDPDTVAAIIIEPVTAGGGVIVPPVDYLQRVEGIAHEYNVKLIVDEVVTGFGRLGSMFAHTPYGIRPDIITMAKGLASGYMPISATAFSQDIFDTFLGEMDSGRHLRHVNTFGGHPVAAAVALANLEVIESEHLCERSQQAGQQLLHQLQDALANVPAVGDIRGMGLLVGVELVTDRQTKKPVSNQVMRAITQYALQRGIILGKASDVEHQRNNVLMFAPPLVITDDEITQLVTIIREAIITVMENPRI